MARGRRTRRREKGLRRIVLIAFPLALLLCLILLILLGRVPSGKKTGSPEGWVFRSPMPPVEKARPRAEKPSGGRLALIIDDGGYNIEIIKKMMEAGKPMAFAILPNSSHAREVARMVHQENFEVMLHLPMEPREEEHYSLEKDTVLTGMEAARVQKILQESLMKVPYVKGVNNHMGSKATEDARIMQALMEALKKEGLYFIDSHTSPRSLGVQMARRAGVPFGNNDKFIDRERNLEKIKGAIRQSMVKAKREGQAIAIGHPHPLTARAIKEMVGEIRGEGIRLVFPSEVVR